MNITYIADSDVSPSLDLQLRTLLSTCFTKPEDYVFKQHRHFKEPPQHRWIIWNENTPIAHIAVHDKIIIADNKEYRIGGIAEVCVHPDHRGKGYVKQLLEMIHTWLTQRGYVYSVLFGKPEVYGSSGYSQVNNMLNDSTDEKGITARKQISALIKELQSSNPWPKSMVYLPGLKF